MRSALLLLVSLPLQASVFYFSGNLEQNTVGSGSKKVFNVLYKREIEPKTLSIIENSFTLLPDDKVSLETYIFNHQTLKVSAYSSPEKLTGEGTFKCEGKFPYLKSCEYQIEVKDHGRYHGTDFYDGDASMTIKAEGEEKDGTRWTAGGLLKKMPAHLFKAKLKKIK